MKSATAIAENSMSDEAIIGAVVLVVVGIICIAIIERVAR